MAGSGSQPSRPPPAATRLPAGPAFDNLFSRGRSVANQFLILKYMPNSYDRTRWGFAVGRRLAPSAVMRNRLRRRLRSIARDSDAPEGVDIVIITRAGALTAPPMLLRQALEQLLARIRAKKE